MYLFCLSVVRLMQIYKNGIISVAEILLDNKLKIEANKINIDDGKLKSFHGISKITFMRSVPRKRTIMAIFGKLSKT